MKFIFSKARKRYIKQIIQVNWIWVIKFDNEEFRTFNGKDYIRKHSQFTDPTPNFYDYYFEISKLITCEKRGITWSNIVHISSSDLYENSTPITLNELKNKEMRLGMKNQAPTEKCSRHHVYYFCLYPFNLDTPFVIGESIHGGIADSGGASHLSLKELLERPGWQRHLTLADCDWAIGLIAREQADIQRLVNILIKERMERYNFELLFE